MDRFCSPTNCDGCPAKIVCRCLDVSEAELVQVISRLELRTIKDIRRHIGAGDGCTCCHPELEQYLEAHACVHAQAG